MNITLERSIADMVIYMIIVDLLKKILDACILVTLSNSSAIHILRIILVHAK